MYDQFDLKSIAHFKHLPVQDRKICHMCSVEICKYAYIFFSITCSPPESVNLKLNHRASSYQPLIGTRQRNSYNIQKSTDDVRCRERRSTGRNPWEEDFELTCTYLDLFPLTTFSGFWTHQMFELSHVIQNFKPIGSRRCIVVNGGDECSNTMRERAHDNLASCRVAFWYGGRIVTPHSRCEITNVHVLSATENMPFMHECNPSQNWRRVRRNKCFTACAGIWWGRVSEGLVRREQARERGREVRAGETIGGR